MIMKAPSLRTRPGLKAAVLVMALLSVTVMAWAGDRAVKDPRTMTFPPVEFAPPEPARVVLDNGMVVYLLEDHELPLVSLSAMMRTGGWLEPADKVGLAALTGAVMRTGGGGGRTAEQIDEELEQFAIDINMAMGRQSGSASLDVLSKDLNRGLQDLRRAFAPAGVRSPPCRAGQAPNDRGYPAPSGQPGVDCWPGIPQAALWAGASQRS